MDIVLFGIQGSGKGTQAKKLAAEFRLTIFEAGAVLRGIAASGSPLGDTVASFIDNGKLVPNEIMMAAVQEALMAIDPAERVLFDGIPRFLEQMQSFDAMMARLNRSFRCLLLELDEETAVQRILSRGAIEGRIDDQDEERIRTRLGWYHEKTEPVIADYKHRNMLVTVDGTGSMGDVYARMKSAVEAMDAIVA